VLPSAAPSLGVTGNSWHSQPAELCFEIVALAVGLSGLWILPIKRVHRALLSVPYVFFMFAWTFMLALPLVCAYFGDCP
jgi:hypothetical protein